MQLHISDEFLKEIGHVAVLQAHIEGGFAIMIANLAGVDTAVGDVLTKPLSFKALAQIAESLLDLRAKELGERRTEAAALVRRARAVEHKRNEIVHSMWSFGPDVDPRVVSRIKLSGSPATLRGHAVPIEDLRALVAEMDAIVDAIVYIHPFLRARSTG